MSTFSQRPYETWKVIEENIQPYLAKLDVVKRKYYENLLSEICNLFDIDKFKENKKNTTVSNSGEFRLQWCFHMVETGGLEPSTSCV